MFCCKHAKVIFKLFFSNIFAQIIFITKIVVERYKILLKLSLRGIIKNASYLSKAKSFEKLFGSGMKKKTGMNLTSQREGVL